MEFYVVFETWHPPCVLEYQIAGLLTLRVSPFSLVARSTENLIQGAGNLNNFCERGNLFVSAGCPFSRRNKFANILFDLSSTLRLFRLITGPLFSHFIFKT